MASLKQLLLFSVCFYFFTFSALSFSNDNDFISTQNLQAYGFLIKAISSPIYQEQIPLSNEARKIATDDDLITLAKYLTETAQLMTETGIYDTSDNGISSIFKSMINGVLNPSASFEALSQLFDETFLTDYPEIADKIDAKYNELYIKLKQFSKDATEAGLPYVEPTTFVSNILFNPDYYLSSYPDLKQAFGNNYGQALKHWVHYGIVEGRQGVTSFSTKDYFKLHPELYKKFSGNHIFATVHWLSYGVHNYGAK